MSAPNDLRNRIQHDLRPTRPLRPPYVRALVLIPLAVAIVLSVPGLRFFRSDMQAIGFLKAWGCNLTVAGFGPEIPTLRAKRIASASSSGECRLNDSLRPHPQSAMQKRTIPSRS